MRRTAPEKLVRALAQPRVPVEKSPPPLRGRPAVDAELERARERARQARREARRTRLHFFGLAGGRRRGQ